MGGFFGTISKSACSTDLFYGTDYNSHLGTRRGGMATYDKEAGFTRSIHNLESSYFRTKFEPALDKFVGNAGIGIISDTDAQPIVINSHLGKFAIVTVAKINNIEELEQDLLKANMHFSELSSGKTNQTELVALLITQGKTDEARFQFQLITEMEPSNAAAWQQLLNLALKSEDIPEVIRICTRCQELFPDAPEYYFYLGIAYFQQEKYQDALDTYKAGLEIIPETNVGLKSDFYGQIGDIYYQIKNMPETYKAYDEALKYNDKNVVVLNNYAYFLSLEKKDLKKAERMSALAVKLEPNNSTYLDTYAWIFFVQGNYTLAKIYIESALANDTTKSSELVDHYGDILFMSGDKEKALEQWKKAKEMGKESEVLDRKIAEGTYIEEEVKNE